MLIIVVNILFSSFFSYVVFSENYRFKHKKSEQCITNYFLIFLIYLFNLPLSGASKSSRVSNGGQSTAGGEGSISISSISGSGSSGSNSSSNSSSSTSRSPERPITKSATTSTKTTTARSPNRRVR